MTSLSLVDGVSAEYEVAGGKPTVILRSAVPLKYTAASFGTASMLFFWVGGGKDRHWTSETKMTQSAPLQPQETTGVDGSQLLTFSLDALQPATGLFLGEMEGDLLVPAIHIEVPGHGILRLEQDVWLLLMRSPWFPLRQGIGKSSLSISRDSSVAVASISPADLGAGLSTQLSVSGTDYKKASLLMRRKIGPFVSDELMGELVSGTQTFSWSPVTRSFDLLLVSRGRMAFSQAENLARDFGASVTSGILGGGMLQGSFVLCDGPMLGYSLVLKGDRGWLEHDADSADMTLSW